MILKKIKIIDDIKNIDTPPLEESLKSLKNEILQKNTYKRKIGLAFFIIHCMLMV